MRTGDTKSERNKPWHPVQQTSPPANTNPTVCTADTITHLLLTDPKDQAPANTEDYHARIKTLKSFIARVESELMTQRSLNTKLQNNRVNT